MAGRSRRLFPWLGSVWAREVPLSGQFTIGASGAVATDTTSDSALISGGTVTKNAAAGRYDIVFYKTFKRVKFAKGSMQGPDTAAFPTTTGSNPQERSVSGDGFTIQFKRQDTEADANPVSGTVVRWFAVVSDS